MEILLRIGSVKCLVILNIIMIWAFRKRSRTIVAKMGNSRRKEDAIRMVDKTLALLNTCQSVLMCINQIPHVSLYAMNYAPAFNHCYRKIASPLADASIFITDSIDLYFILLISKKM